MLIFTDKSKQPSQSELEKALGDKLHLFEAVLRENGINETMWKFYSKSSGWTLQCKQNGRNLFYVQVFQSGFCVWITLGRQAKGKALEVLKNEQLRKVISSAREYAEGTSCKVEMETSEDVANIVLLTALKSS